MTKVGPQRVMQGALLLTLTSLLVKVLSAIYRVPFQNMVGDEGFYVYQQVYPIYGIAMTLSLSGLPVFMSKLVAEKKTLAAKEAVVKGLFPLFFWLSLLSFFGLFIGGQWLARMMGDLGLAPLIKLVAFVFLLTPFLTIYRGYYQGELLMVPTAYSQLVEQVSRVAVILIAAYLFNKIGWSIYQMGAIAMSGALFGGLGALVVLLWYRPKAAFLNPTTLLLTSSSFSDSRLYGRRLLLEGSVICGYSALLILFQLVDSFVIKNQLVLSGLSETTAKLTKGTYDRGQPLLQVGMVIGVALTTSFLPTLTKYHAAGQASLYQRTSQIFLKISLAIASAASLGLIFVLPDLNRSLFGDNGEQQALRLLMGAVFLMSLILTIQTLYQSTNQAKPPLMALSAGLLCKIISSPGLTHQLGTSGASLATLLSLTTTLLILGASFRGEFFKKPETLSFIWKLSQCLGMMGLSLSVYRQVVGLILPVETNRLLLLIIILGSVLVGGSVFIKSALWRELLTVREWLAIPLGKRILRLKK